MWSNRAAITSFWKKFGRFLIFGFSLFVLVYAAQASLFKDIQNVQAVQGCSEVRQYNECTGCNTSRRVAEDDCGNFSVVVDSQDDPACSASCPVQPPTCTENKETFGQCGGTAGLEGRDPTHQFEVAKFTNSCTGEVRFEFVGDAGPAAACGAQTCTETTRDFPQCGGSVGLENEDKTHTFIVREFTNTCTQAKRFQKIEDKGNLGQCQTCTETTRDFPQCGGSVGLENEDKTHTFIVREFTNTCTQAKRFEMVEDKGNLGQCQVNPNPTATPAPPAPTSTPVPGCTSNGSCSAATPACGTTSTGVDNCGNACSKKGADCVIGCTPNGSCSVQMPSSCGQKNTGVDNCGNTCTRETAACSSGGPNITNNNTNTNNNTQTQTVTVAQTGAQVAGVTSLPKTGLPELAWSALAFVPAGFGMRKFRGLKKTQEDDPQYIWENRQFKGKA